MLVADHLPPDSMVVRRRPAAHTTFFGDARLASIRSSQKDVLQLPLRRLESRKSDFVDVAHDPPPRLGPRARDAETSTDDVDLRASCGRADGVAVACRRADVIASTPLRRPPQVQVQYVR